MCFHILMCQEVLILSNHSEMQDSELTSVYSVRFQPILQQLELSPTQIQLFVAHHFFVPFIKTY